MIGSYRKGKTGENYLRNMMTELLKMGFVRQNVPLGSKTVEYCVKFSDGKLLAIDSKVVATKEMETLFDEKASEDDRIDAGNKIKSVVRRKVEEVCKYIDPTYTLPCAVIAVPDSIIPLSSDIVPEAVGKNVMIVGYSAVPQLIVYFIRIHGFYSIREDIGELRDRLMVIQSEVSKLDDRFFANRIERPMTMLTNAVLKMRQVIGGINNILSLQREEPVELTGELSSE
jgi:DNA anti-recombination protein RmuC